MYSPLKFETSMYPFFGDIGSSHSTSENRYKHMTQNMARKCIETKWRQNFGAKINNKKAPKGTGTDKNRYAQIVTNNELIGLSLSLS